LESAPARVSGLLAGTLDWRLLIELAAAHGMLPLLSRALPAESPAAARTEIQSKAAALAIRSLRMAAELTGLFAALESAAVSAVAFKGPALSHLAYGDLALRTFNDLDVFVPRSQLPAALDVLAARGYAKKSEAWNAGFSGACEVVLQRPDSLCEVDLHWRFSPPYFLAFDAPRAAARAIEIRDGGFAVRALRPEDHLLYLCIHAAREGWSHVRFPCDVAGLAARRALDWEDLVSEARRTGCLRVLSVGLDLARRLCQAPIPAEILPAIRLDSAGSRLAAAAQSALVRQAAGGALVHLRAFESWSARARYVALRSIQPNQLDAEWVRLPARFSGAYYLVRPCRLAWTALGRVARR
jgi:hypothetical protein